MSNLYRGPSIDAYYQVAVHLAKGFHRRKLKCERLTDDRRRTPSHGKSSLCRWQCELNCKVLSRSLCLIWQYIKQYSLFYILEVFRNRPIRNKNCLWRPCLLMDRDKMSNLYKGPSIDASYQVSVQMWKVNGRRMPSDGKKLTLPLARWAKKSYNLFMFVQITS